MKEGGREESQVLLLLPGLSGLLHESHQKASGQGLGGQGQLSKVDLLTGLSAIEVFKHPHQSGQWSWLSPQFSPLTQCWQSNFVIHGPLIWTEETETHHKRARESLGASLGVVPSPHTILSVIFFLFNVTFKLVNIPSSLYFIWEDWNLEKKCDVEKWGIWAQALLAFRVFLTIVNDSLSICVPSPEL